MYYTPKTLDKFLIRDLKRLNETDCPEAIKIICQRMVDLRNENYYLTIPVEELPLSTRASNALLYNNLDTVGHVIDYGWEKLKLIQGLGPQTLDEIKGIIERVIEKKVSIRGLSGTDLRMGLGRL